MKNFIIIKKNHFQVSSDTTQTASSTYFKVHNEQEYSCSQNEQELSIKGLHVEGISIKDINTFLNAGENARIEWERRTDTRTWKSEESFAVYDGMGRDAKRIS